MNNNTGKPREKSSRVQRFLLLPGMIMCGAGVLLFFQRGSLPFYGLLLCATGSVPLGLGMMLSSSRDEPGATPRDESGGGARAFCYGTGLILFIAGVGLLLHLLQN